MADIPAVPGSLLDPFSIMEKIDIHPTTRKHQDRCEECQRRQQATMQYHAFLIEKYLGEKV